MMKTANHAQTKAKLDRTTAFVNERCPDPDRIERCNKAILFWNSGRPAAARALIDEVIAGIEFGMAQGLCEHDEDGSARYEAMCSHLNAEDLAEKNS